MTAPAQELLLELQSEEIPARMQLRAAEDLKRLVVDGLSLRGLKVGAASAYVTPRRLALVVNDVPVQSPAISEERKGPRVGAPEQAIQGFLKSAGIAKIEDAQIVVDGKKGSFYVARIDKPGRGAAEIIAETLSDVMAKFPWPKSQRWGASDFRWVRPLQSILCILGGKIVPFTIAGLASSNRTIGHRFHGRDTLEITSFEDYGTKLKAAKVILPSSERALWIGEQARAIAKKNKLELVEDEALMAENAGLTEWPTVMMGSFDESFLSVPAECLMTSMKAHQKCFSLRDPKTGKLANKFLLVSNLIADDDGKEIVAGNEKVIRARLSDAKFFWDQDLKKPLDEMATALAGITFHAKLGTQAERVERIMELAHKLAPACDADPQDARRAAQLAKADLVSGMVGEFPELQGLMGRYYAEKAKAKPEIARAIELHYKPKGPTDSVPKEDTDAVACAVALADKIDTLVGFWSIGEKPTGSGDPFQLRRAALGVIRIVLENDFRISQSASLASAAALLQNMLEPAVLTDLIGFFLDRLKVYLRDKGTRHDLIDAVFALEGQDDLALIVKRIDALAGLLETDDGKNLLAGVKRAENILTIEEKKDKTRYIGGAEIKLMSEPQEQALAAAVGKSKSDVAKALDVENFAGAMRALADLRAPVDAFFDKVTVNATEPAVRINRLKLLSEIRDATRKVADFSKITG